MKLTVLVHNNTLINEYYGGEPAVSYYIENEEDAILLDVGYSGRFSFGLPDRKRPVSHHRVFS